MTSFGSSSSVQQEEVGKVLINKNEQKWKGCHSCLIFKSCDPHLFHFTLPAMSLRSQILISNIVNQMGSLNHEADVNLALRGEPDKLTHCVMVQYIRPGIRLQALQQGPEVLLCPPCMRSGSADFALHVFSWFPLLLRKSSSLAPVPTYTRLRCAPTGPRCWAGFAATVCGNRFLNCPGIEESFPTHTGKSNTICPTLHSFGLGVLIYSFTILLHASFFFFFSTKAAIASSHRTIRYVTFPLKQ